MGDEIKATYHDVVHDYVRTNPGASIDHLADLIDRSTSLIYDNMSQKGHDPTLRNCIALEHATGDDRLLRLHARRLHRAVFEIPAAAMDFSGLDNACLIRESSKITRSFSVLLSRVAKIWEDEVVDEKDAKDVEAFRVETYNLMNLLVQLTALLDQLKTTHRKRRAAQRNAAQTK